MYHDQGQIAMKLLGFERGVTVHGGLPIPITTPAHGTAFDIAGQGKANPRALKRALELCAQMVGSQGQQGLTLSGVCAMSTTLAIHGGEPARNRPWPGWPQWDESEQSGLMAVLERGEWGGYDAAVADFENAFAARHAARFCVTAVNGTTTLETALRALGIGRGDEVIVPPYTFIATAAAVRIVGATPVFVDVDLETWNLSVSAVEAAVNPRTKAVIPVHFGGLSVDLDSLLPLARRHNLVVIEDAAHAHGSSWRGQPVGALGTVGSFSFQTSKNLTAGEGGALLTNDDDLAELLWSIVNCGRRRSGDGYEHPNLGTNLRLSGWHAAVLSAGLSRLDDQLQRRMSNARRLRSFLAEVDGLSPQRWDPAPTPTPIISF